MSSKTNDSSMTPSIETTEAYQPISAIIDGSIILTEDFTESSYDVWKTFGNVDFKSNTVEISGHGGITRYENLAEKEGMVFLLKFEPGEFNVYLVDKSSNGDQYIGFKTNNGYDLILSAGINNRWIGGSTFNGNLFFKPGEWYFVMIKILEGGDFYIRVWEKDNPDIYREKMIRFGKDWEDKTWHPAVIVTSGNVVVDLYQEFLSD